MSKTFNALVKGAYRGKGKRTGSPGNYRYIYDEPAGDKLRLVDSKSPLDYHGIRPDRLSLEGVEPADGKQSYFPEGSKTVGFADYSVQTRHSMLDGKPYKSVFVHYISVRNDHRGKGRARALVDSLYKKFKDANEIDWGRLHSDAMVDLLRQRKANEKVGEPRTYFKSW